MHLINTLIYFIIFIKVIFIGCSLASKVLSYKDKKKYKTTIETLEYYRDRAEFMFVVGMSILLIYIFNPHFARRPPIDKEMKILLFLYGWVMIFTADWSTFLGETDWLQVLLKKMGVKSENKSEKEKEEEANMRFYASTEMAQGGENNLTYENVNPYDDNVYSAYYANATYTGNTITQLPTQPKGLTEEDKKKIQKQKEKKQTQVSGI